METGYVKCTSLRELKKDNKMVYLLSKALPIKEIRKLTGQKCGAWYEEESLGRLTGFELIMKDGNQCYIDTEIDGEYIALYKLFIREKGKGLGSSILEFYRDYTKEAGAIFMVCQVINPDFFNKFEWLSFDGLQTYEYNG